MMWITASPITTVIAKVTSTQTYGVADIWVEMCSLVYMIFYIPVVFPSNYILDKFGLRAGVIIGIGLTTLGAWVRIGAYFDFWFILAGSCLGAIGQPFLMNAPAKLAATWFRPEMVNPI
jgi:FLVCR family feline leukemia virus subgroup C receptor-related protein